MFGGDSLQKLAHERIADVEEQLIELFPHLLDRPRRGQDAVLLAKTLTPILIGVHAADILDDELQPAIEQLGPPLHFDEVAAVELLAQAGRLVEDARPYQTGAVLQ